jgi:hypothetical protein
VISGLSLFTPAPPGGGGLPSPVAPAGPLKVKIAKPRFKSQLKRGKVRLTSTVKVSATGLSAASCGGRLNATAKIGRKSVAKKSFPFKFSGGACAAKLNLAIAKQYDGKKAALALTISSVLVTAPQFKASVRL